MGRPVVVLEKPVHLPIQIESKQNYDNYYEYGIYGHVKILSIIISEIYFIGKILNKNH